MKNVRRKRILSIIVIMAMIMSLGALSACNNGSGGSSGNSDSSGGSGSSGSDATASDDGDAEEGVYGMGEGLELPIATSMANADVLNAVCTELEEAGLSNVATFKEWVSEFNAAVGGEAGLAPGWVTPEEISPDIAKCMDGWEAAYTYSDTNCRMTALLLAGDLITSEKLDESYEGTYLMFDVDAVNNTPKYSYIKEKIDLFTTLFSDKELAEGEAPSKYFGKMWADYGFKINSDKVSLVSVIIYDEYFNQAFVGHTGLLIDEGDSYLFIEKIAFEQPYQATRVNQVEDLMSLFSTRAEYFGAEGDIGPYVYVNDEFIGVPSR